MLNLHLITGGGDLGFLGCGGNAIEKETAKAVVRNIAIGNQDGEPVAHTGWWDLFLFIFSSFLGEPAASITSTQVRAAPV